MNRRTALALACGFGLTGMASAREGAQPQERFEPEVRFSVENNLRVEKQSF